LASKAIEFGENTQNKGYYEVGISGIGRGMIGVSKHPSAEV